MSIQKHQSTPCIAKFAHTHTPPPPEKPTRPPAAYADPPFIPSWDISFGPKVSPVTSFIPTIRVKGPIDVGTTWQFFVVNFAPSMAQKADVFVG